jgi:hypothetical protein
MKMIEDTIQTFTNDKSTEEEPIELPGQRTKLYYEGSDNATVAFGKGAIRDL